MVKSRVKTDHFQTKIWKSGFGACYNQGSNPSSVNNYTRVWSDDLEISRSNPYHLIGTYRARFNRIGGDFKVVKRDYHAWSTLGEGNHLFENDYGVCHGAFWAPQYAKTTSFNNSNWPAVSPSSFAALKADGRKAISMVAPTSPSFSTAEFLGDLRQGLPVAAGLARTGEGRAQAARRAGSEYLNIEFGWKPLLADIRNFRDTVINHRKIIERYRRNSDRLLKKSWMFPMESTTTFTDHGTGYYPQPTSTDSWMYTSSGRRTTTTTVSKRKWFEGVFKYNLPPTDSFEEKYSLIDKAWGVKITPDTIWELSPWSWAADYVSDIGVLMQNISAFDKDGLVMPWAYVMEETKSTVTYELFGVKYNESRTHVKGTHHFKEVFTTTVKQRVAASPYGFHVDWEQFTPKQLANLAAAGIQLLR